jgi:hypothetical protein
MEKQKVNQILSKIADLDFEISMWSAGNSQSNPGAVMNLRWMKKEVQKLRDELAQYKTK